MALSYHEALRHCCLSSAAAATSSLTVHSDHL